MVPMEIPSEVTLACATSALRQRTFSVSRNSGMCPGTGPHHRTAPERPALELRCHYVARGSVSLPAGWTPGSLTDTLLILLKFTL